MRLDELPDAFTSQDLADALSTGGQSTAGTKAERIQRLVGQGGTVHELLDSFLADALRGACAKLGVPTGRKAAMVEELTGLLDDPQQTLSAGPEPTVRAATREDVVSVLGEQRVPRRKARHEYDAQEELGLALRSHFEDVAFEYNVGGYFGLKVDLDIGHGKIGVEVKLAEALFTPAEAQRAIGQAVYCQNMRYSENLVVAVVGDKDDLGDPAVIVVTTALLPSS